MPPLENDIAAISRISAVPTILKVIAETTGLGYMVIARVTQQRWVACAVLDRVEFGLKAGGELDVATTICSEIRDSLQPIIIEHASHEPAYCGHPTPKRYNFESYIAVPVFRRSGEYFGTLCALDPKPAQLRDQKTLAMFNLFAELISLQLAAEEVHSQNVVELLEHKATAELREQFMAVLGHDLRNPLGSILAGAEVLLARGVESGPSGTVERIRRSARRIELLVSDLLDLTRARIGGGLPLARTEIRDLDAVLRHVIDELASQHPQRVVRFVVQGSGSLIGDRHRLEQVLSNLLGNAIQHGDPSQPVEVELVYLTDAARARTASVELRVRNRGTPIPEAVLTQLFQPFYRAGSSDLRTGLGLGLFIVAEIAKAHGGTASVSSTDDGGTLFSVTLPQRAA